MALILTIVMIFTLAGCSSSGGVTIATFPQNGGYSTVIGSYKAVRAEYQGQVVTGPQLPTIICNLEAGGSGSFGNDTDMRPTTWTQNGNVITIALVENPGETTTLTVEGNNLVHMQGDVKITLSRLY